MNVCDFWKEKRKTIFNNTEILKVLKNICLWKECFCLFLIKDTNVPKSMNEKKERQWWDQNDTF